MATTAKIPNRSRGAGRFRNQPKSVNGIDNPPVMRLGQSLHTSLTNSQTFGGWNPEDMNKAYLPAGTMVSD